MNKTYLSRKISVRLSLRAAARMICCILTLALWGPARAGAQAQSQPLSVNTISGKLALTYNGHERKLAAGRDQYQKRESDSRRE